LERAAGVQTGQQPQTSESAEPAQQQEQQEQEETDPREELLNRALENLFNRN